MSYMKDYYVGILNQSDEEIYKHLCDIHNRFIDKMTSEEYIALELVMEKLKSSNKQI